MSDIAIAIHHIDELLKKGQTWDSLYSTKLSRLDWLQCYVSGLPKDEQQEYADEIFLLKSVIKHLIIRRGE